ncbi:MAG: hypothetical protein D4R63_07735 [Methylococcaceae bacterium]|nr:MAG: hypothetical protein D4R63_07735 [Methylococcaceae bacterium]
MTQLNDLIEINNTGSPAAIVVGQSLSNHNLVNKFAPTKAAVTLLTHLQKAVCPEATQEQRALNIHGSYGSGKSHTAVVIAQLLRDGCGDSEFTHLFDRLRHFGAADLADKLKNTFLPADDVDAKPYLLVSLYGSGTTSLGAKLFEGLYEALERHPNLSPAEILPTTEYETCIKRFEAIVSRSPELAKADLSQWQMAEHFLETEDMLEGLIAHQTLALELFKRWHKAVCNDAPFNPASEGGNNFINSYFEASKNLAEKHSFGGIVVVWDEFGLALEDLINNPYRNIVTEIFELQEFVEKACSPPRGHTLFMGLTHKSFPQYASGCDDTVRNRLDTIFGRFMAFKIELSAAESEGYHLLGMQRSWTEFGKQQWQQSNAKQQLVAACSPLPLFKNLGQQLLDVSECCYPLHPVMAAGLFALSALAQANRTALTFFRLNADKILSKTVNEQALFSQELIRLPELVDYYRETIEDKKAHEVERYQRARNKIPAELNADETQGRIDILKLLLLSELLGENFQTNETFLACALYDTQPTHSAAEHLHTDLAWLKAEELIWKSDLTHQWTLLGDSGVNVEGLIEGKLTYFAGRSPETLLNDNPAMREDLFPVLGLHELEPSPCGIVRSYEVILLTPPMTNTLKLSNPLLSGQVYLVLAKDAEEVAQVKARIQETSHANIYFWLPSEGIRSESVSYNGKDFKLGGLLCRYLALKLLLKEKTATDDLRRQLTTKWEKTRKDLLYILQILYGREGLTNGKSEILQAGTAQAIACKSWYEFRSILTRHIQALYDKEIPIRAMNMNVLHDESYARSSKVRKIVERIIKFDDNPTYQSNDLLGEEKDTSETSALIDGVLGANQLFIQRLPDKWDIKKVEETEGAVKAVLTLLHKTLLLKNRDKPYPVSELREKLVAPPYGIPACNLAILAAVAVRYDFKRLRWGSHGNEPDFATNLTNAFIADSKVTIRLIEFTARQFAMLYAVGVHVKMVKKDDQTQEEYGSECAARLREFVNKKADVIKFSNQLNDKPKDLVKFLQAVPTKNAQDFAEFLLSLYGLEHKSPGDIPELAKPLLKELLEDFERVENLRQHEIKQTLQQICPQDSENKARLVARLNHEHTTPQAKAVGQLLEQHLDVSDIDVKKVTQVMLNKPFEQCTDTEIGQCKGKLESLIEHHQQHVPPYSQPTVAIEETLISTKEILITILSTHIQQANLPKQEIREALRSILLHYED